MIGHQHHRLRFIHDSLSVPHAPLPCFCCLPRICVVHERFHTGPAVCPCSRTLPAAPGASGRCQRFGWQCATFQRWLWCSEACIPFTTVTNTCICECCDPWVARVVMSLRCFVPGCRCSQLLAHILPTPNEPTSAWMRWFCMSQLSTH